MRKYTKLIILSSILLVVIALITLAMIFDVDLILFKNLSIISMQNKKIEVDGLIQEQTLEELNNSIAKSELEISKNAFDVAKETYENIDESTISIVQEATKEENYFIEYLWVVLGNYATTNGVDIRIVTPGDKIVVEQENAENKEESDKNSSENNNTTQNNNTAENNENTTDITTSAQESSLTSGIKITVEGRYANVADFVFDVENDKSLRFKLDNIVMTYSGDNKVKATFDVLSLSVLK